MTVQVERFILEWNWVSGNTQPTQHTLTLVHRSIEHSRFSTKHSEVPHIVRSHFSSWVRIVETASAQRMEHFAHENSVYFNMPYSSTSLKPSEEYAVATKVCTRAKYCASSFVRAITVWWMKPCLFGSRRRFAFFFSSRKCLFTQNPFRLHTIFIGFLLDNFYLCGEHFVRILCTFNVYTYSAVSLFTDERTHELLSLADCGNGIIIIDGPI